MKLQPRNLMFIDGVGALVTATSLGVIMPQFPEYFKLPSPILNLLAVTAACMSLYSLTCAFTKKVDPIFFKIIAGINTLYCLSTLLLLILHRESISLLDWMYFIGEILIVMTLVRFEWRVVRS